jgi:PBP1b-binding outer membrane lipoprotein LpoB
MRSSILGALLASAILLVACDSKKSAPETATTTATQTTRAPLVDLTTASSLAAVRAAFNAHKGEARFLTLLSPT